MAALRWLMPLVAAATVAAIVPVAGSAGAAKGTAQPFSPRHGAVRGIVPAHGAAQPFAQGSGDLIYHGGPVMRTNQTYTIFWAPSGYAYPSGYESLINRYLTDVAHDSGGSGNVYGLLNQYFDGTGSIAYTSTFAGTIDDTNAYPASGCRDGFGTTECLTDAQLQSEIASVVAAQGWPSSGTAEYFVVTPPSVGSCLDGTSTQCSYSYYCAYHSSFPVAGGEDIYANMPYAHVTGCSTGESPNASAADDTINVISHEHSEAITDPNGDAWWDAAGYEVGDKCNFDFGSPLGGTAGAEYNQVINGDHYWIQREYDNATHSCLRGPATSSSAVVTSVTPSALGQGAQNVKMAIKGSNFASGATVSVSGAGVTVNSVTFVTSTRLTAKFTVSSTAAPGTYDVSVTNAGGSPGTCAGCLTVDPGPVVSSTSPSTGPRGATEAVRVFGANFANGATVSISKGVSVTSTAFVDSGEIDVTINITSTKVGWRTVTVKNPDHGIGTLANGFSVT